MNTCTAASNYFQLYNNISMEYYPIQFGMTLQLLTNLCVHIMEGKVTPKHYYTVHKSIFIFCFVLSTATVYKVEPLCMAN